MKETTMAIGPVQLLVLGFDQPDFQGEILAELDRLKESDVVRVIDGIAVHKNAEGEITMLERSDLTEEQAAEFGAVVGALLGFGAGGDEGAEEGALLGAAAALADDGEPSAEEWDVLSEIPEDSAAAILLIEHRWAIPLRDAVRRANGFPISDGFIHPEDLVAIGMLAAAEAEALSS
jgi:uncharacterized membrane protein